MSVLTAGFDIDSSDTALSITSSQTNQVQNCPQIPFDVTNSHDNQILIIALQLLNRPLICYTHATGKFPHELD